MRTFSTSSRNSLNRGPLQSSDGGGFGATSSSLQLTNTEIGTSQSVDTEILLSYPAIVPIFDEEGSEGDLDLSADDMVDSDDDVFIESPARVGKKTKSGDLKGKGAGSAEATTFQKLKKNYDLQRKFHNEWAAKEPWSEAVLAEDSAMHLVRCRPCFLVRGKPVHMALKWDIISKYGQWEIHKNVWLCMLLVVPCLWQSRFRVAARWSRGRNKCSWPRCSICSQVGDL